MSNPAEQVVLADLYDYPSVPFVQTHPDRMATLARLAGLNPPPVDRCRVLEVACGEGANTIGMAYTLPNSTFVGMDLGRNPIDKANAAVKELGLKNVRFVCENLLEFDPGAEKFDYVIAHGFYSWVPQVVRERLLELLREVLAPHGVAYISFNAYPGCYSERRLRDFVLLHRDVMRAAHPGSLESANDQIVETRRVLELLRDNRPSDAAPPREDMFWEAKMTVDRPPAIARALIFHDIHSDHWNPFTLKEFVHHAETHGLQFLDEATPAEPDLPKIAAPIRNMVRQLSRGDRVLEMQYIDYLIGRPFHRSLLCRADAPRSPEDQVAAIEGLYADSRMAETSTAADGSVTFQIPDYVSVSTPAPAVIAILRRLIAAFPQRVAIKEFETGDAESDRGLHALFLRMYRSGTVDLYTQPSPAGAPTGKPLASAVARYQSKHQTTLGNLLHDRIDLADEHALWFLNLLDGSRDHEALLEEARQRYPGRSRGELANQIFGRLDEFRKLGLLHAQDG